MPTADRVILVVDDQPERAQQLKDLIEFMDSPEVRIVRPEEWAPSVADIRIAAVFLTESIDSARADRLIRDIGRMDPNVPIVIVNGDSVEKNSL